MNDMRGLWSSLVSGVSSEGMWCGRQKKIDWDSRPSSDQIQKISQHAAESTVFDVSEVHDFCVDHLPGMGAAEIGRAYEYLVFPSTPTLWCSFLSRGCGLWWLSVDAGRSLYAGYYLNTAGCVLQMDSDLGLKIAAGPLISFANLFASCRNVQPEVVKTTRQWRRRMVRESRPVLNEYRVLHLYPKAGGSGGPPMRGTSVTAGADGGDRDGPRFHMVRGHFKQRKSGMYWWHPFWRGRPDRGIIVKDYTVGPDRPERAA